MKRKILATVVCAVVVAVPTVFADYYVPSPMCSKPYKPLKFNSDYEYQNYMRQVEAYRACIAAFIEDQYDAAARHNKAASNAIDEWNRFVQDN